MSGTERLSATRQHRRLVSIVGSLLVLLPLLPLAGPAALAQEQDPAEFTVLDDTLDLVEDAWVRTPLILWPEGRRAYQIAESPASGTPDTVVPIDLDTLEPITQVVDGEGVRVDSGPLVPALYTQGARFALQREQIALDRDTGVLFLPHHSMLPGGLEGPSVPLLRPGKDTTCKNGGLGLHPVGDVCLGGVHVLDLSDDALPPVALEGPNPIPFHKIGLDGVITTPVLRAMSHTDVGGGRGKLHLLVEEHAHTLGAAEGGLSPRDVMVPQYVVQIDVDTGAHDWVVRAPGCRSVQGVGEGVMGPPSHTIFVRDGAGGPQLYVGCYGPSSVGTVGRLTLDPENVSAPPTASETFPGPANVASIDADPAAGRVWFKSVAAGEEAWWVFDGGVSNYLGVVGIDDETGSRSSGRIGHVDPTTGRLYVFEGATEDQAIEGGLYVADGRRVPIPQARIHRFDAAVMRDLMHFTERDDESAEVDYERDEDGERTGNYHEGLQGPQMQQPLVVDTPSPNRPRRLFVRPGAAEEGLRWYVVADRRPVADTVVDVDTIEAQGVEDPPATDDVRLDDERVRTTYTGTARGYGLRTLLLGGTDAILVPGAQSSKYYEAQFNDPFAGKQRKPSRFLPCGATTREFMFGLSGSAEPKGQPAATLQPGSSRGAAVPVHVDDQTRRDLADPVDRCGDDLQAFVRQLPTAVGNEVDETVADALADLGVRDPREDLPPVDDAMAELGVRDPRAHLPDVDDTDARPGYDGEAFEGAVACSAPVFGDDGSVQPSSTDSSGDEQLVGPAFTATVTCENEVLTSGRSRARFVSAGPVSVADSYSEYEVVRDPATGRVLGTARAYARGISIVHDVTDADGEAVGTSRVTIDEIETRAAAWATGRGRPDGVPDGCEDPERTAGAGTCLQRTISGATVVDGRTGKTFRCGDDCASNEQFVAAMQAALGDSWTVRLRQPDALKAAGFDNGTLAGLQKREIDEFADTILKFDLIKTLPGLEVVRYNDNVNGRGRQVYQFAGVELNTVFTRQCLGLVEGEACVAPPVPLAQVEVNLTDGLEGSPLAGGRFELTQTSAVSGATPLDSPVSCTTNATGRCELVGLPAGSYTLTQTDAPGDYAPAEPLSLDLSPGSIFDVSVSNVREVGSVVAGLTDLDGVPLAGGMFELHADVDGDGTVGLDDPQVDVCTTGADGTCTMADLPLGAYVLSQAAAPDGYAAVDDQVPFVLDVPGQTATIGYSNAPAGSGASGGGSLGAVAELPPTQPVAVERPPGAEGPQVADPQASSALPRAPFPQQLAEAWQLLRRNPVQAAAFGLLLALAAAAVAGPMRRRLLLLTAG